MESVIVGFIVGAIAMKFWQIMRGGLGKAHRNAVRMTQVMMLDDMVRFFGEERAMAFMKEAVAYRFKEIEDMMGE